MSMLSDFVTFNDPKLAKRYSGKKMPMATFLEAYFDGDVDLKSDLEDLLAAKHRVVRFVPTTEHLKFIVTHFVPEVVIHSKAQDVRIAQDHYDRGNDFFGWFLGERMVYTSAFFRTGDENLETAQDQKMELVCRKLQLKKNESFLDIGCGWGTLAMYASKNYGTDSTGITAAERQTEFANGRIQDAGLSDDARILCMDYRDIPKRKFDKIACLEMAEHVGIKNFQKFMNQIAGLLTDDGLFYLQIAGLRAGFHLEDLVWGLFMSKYIFPGADASTPLSFVVKRLEKAGFEIHSVENIGIHYSHTIHRWYQNWCANKNDIVAAYGERWFRIWHLFLAWSTQIAAQGSSTCFQIVCNKNRDHFNRNIFIGPPSLGESKLGDFAEAS